MKTLMCRAWIGIIFSFGGNRGKIINSVICRYKERDGGTRNVKVTAWGRICWYVIWDKRECASEYNQKKNEEWTRKSEEKINFAKGMLRVFVRLSAAQQCNSSCQHRKVTHSAPTETVNKSKSHKSRISITLTIEDLRKRFIG